MEYTFTHREATVDDVETLYQFGVDNPARAEVACTALPYPLKSVIQDAVDGDGKLVVFYDGEDDSLLAFAHFWDDGTVRHVAMRRLTPEGVANGDDPKANAFGAYLFGTIKSYAGRAIVVSPNPNIRDTIIASGGEFPAEA